MVKSKETKEIGYIKLTNKPGFEQVKPDSIKYIIGKGLIIYKKEIKE